MPDPAVVIAGIAGGSALGGMARFFVSGLVARAIGETFPWGTLVVNVTGAFAIGVAAGAARHAAPLLANPGTWQIVVTGFLGGYTTVSSFSLQTQALMDDGVWLRALGNIALSLLLCFSAVTLGYLAGGSAAGNAPW